MKKKKYVPYGINIDYALKTYMHIGKDYGNRKTENLGLWFNFRRWYRKRHNKGERYYKICNTYSEWENYVKSLLPKQISNYNDMMHWLYGEMHNENIFLECIKLVLIPIYITIFTIFNEIEKLNVISRTIVIIIFMAIIIKCSVGALYESSKKVKFYEDFIEIAGSIKQEIIAKIEDVEERKTMAIKEKSNIVYYYCDTATALSVLKNNKLWLTSIRNLNDSNEEISIYKIFCEQLREYDYSKQRKLAKFFEKADMVGYFQLYTHCLGMSPYYITCFSRDDDSVSQWMSYADGGNGIAIGFEEEELEKLDNIGMINYFQVNYIDYDSIQLDIEEIYEKMVLCDIEDGVGMMNIFMEFMNKKYERPEKYKSYHYSSEKEVRIVFDESENGVKMCDGWELGEVDTYAKRNCINTYVPLSFPKSAVKKIVLGPMYQRNYFEPEFAIMGSLGYLGIEIVSSTSGFRGIR